MRPTSGGLQRSSVRIAILLHAILLAPPLEASVWRSRLHPSDSLYISTSERGEATLHAPARFLAVGFWRNDRFVGFARVPDTEPGPESDAVPSFRILDAMYLDDSLFATSTREGMDASSPDAERWQLTSESVREFAARVALPGAPTTFVERVPGAFDVAPIDREPVPIKRAAPSYPDSARQAGIEGTVLVRALVSREGRVTRTVIERSVPGLDEESQRAVMRWTFKPARYRGRVVPRWVTIPVKFSMH